MTEGVLSHSSFKCLQCGTCCRKQKVVILTIYDIFRVSERLGVRPGEFYRRYCLKSDKFNNEGLMRIYLKAEGGCPFLKGNLCSIHDSKPIVCSQSPFYFPESSLAAYKVFGMIIDECCISQLPYDTMTEGDLEQLTDMHILVGMTDEYMRRYKKFDEKTGVVCYAESLHAIRDQERRKNTRAMLLDQSISREDMCRNDPYYRGATGMYISGFYKEHLNEVEQEKMAGNDVYAFQPSALGTIDGVATLVLFDEDYKAVKKALSGVDTGIINTRAFIYGDMEYVTVRVRVPGTGKVIMSYYYTSLQEKKAIRHLPDRIAICFRDEKGNGFIFSGEDADGWLNIIPRFNRKELM